MWLLAAGACNYSSGPGNFGVLRDVRLGVVPTANAVDLGLTDNINGNPHYFNFENDHLGDGGPLPQVQFDAIVTATQVVADHFGLDAATQTISHAEHTKRKSDPYWNGNRRAIEEIRLALQEVPVSEKIELKSWARPSFQWMIDNGYYTEQTDLDLVRETYGFQQITVNQHRALMGELGKHVQNHPGGGGGLSADQVKAIINDSQIVAPV